VVELRKRSYEKLGGYDCEQDKRVNGEIFGKNPSRNEKSTFRRILLFGSKGMNPPGSLRFW
jgi:hypothetical protein